MAKLNTILIWVVGEKQNLDSLIEVGVTIASLLYQRIRVTVKIKSVKQNISSTTPKRKHVLI